MAKAELGTKRICPDTGRKFYDLGKTPVVSPYTGKVVPITPPPQSRARPEPAQPAPVAAPPHRSPRWSYPRRRMPNSSRSKTPRPNSRVRTGGRRCGRGGGNRRSRDRREPRRRRLHRGRRRRRSRCDRHHRRDHREGRGDLTLPKRARFAGLRRDNSRIGAIAQMGERVNGIHEVGG